MLKNTRTYIIIPLNLTKTQTDFYETQKKSLYKNSSFGKVTTNELCLRCVYFRKKKFTPRNAYYITRPTKFVRISVSFVFLLYLSSRSVYSRANVSIVSNQ